MPNYNQFPRRFHSLPPPTEWPLVVETPTFYTEELMSTNTNFLVPDPRCDSVELLLMPDDARTGDMIIFSCPDDEVPVRVRHRGHIDAFSLSHTWMLKPYLPGVRAMTFMLLSREYLEHDPFAQKVRTYVEVWNPAVLIVAENPSEIGAMPKLGHRFSHVDRLRMIGGDHDFVLKIYYNKCEIKLEIDEGPISTCRFKRDVVPSVVDSYYPMDFATVLFPDEQVPPQEGESVGSVDY